MASTTLGYEETQLIHAVFKKDYAELEMLDNQRDILQSSVCTIENPVLYLGRVNSV
ncbi:hypothetical protein BDV28DRAFT_153514 [Aspergillus coremiiformis]|uniref:Uncharacterized protein n=1 Tax=Aspergillus coremiiformis TaxID=138285 RepID=A0A5N6YTN2_9EURO|nr:hypothetical protein BDV28DRAFT_153514 [Aspergillus coremiiformis]